MLTDLLGACAVPDSGFDEMQAASGMPRAHRGAFVRALAAREGAEIGDTLALMEREIRENGVTYNVYADPKGADRPWEVDRCRCCCRPPSGTASRPASRSAPTC